MSTCHLNLGVRTAWQSGIGENCFTWYPRPSLLHSLIELWCHLEETAVVQLGILVVICPLFNAEALILLKQSQ